MAAYTESNPHISHLGDRPYVVTTEGSSHVQRFWPARRYGWVLIGISVAHALLFVALGIALAWNMNWQSMLVIAAAMVALSLVVNRRTVQASEGVPQSTLVWQKRTQNVVWWGVPVLVAAHGAGHVLGTPAEP